MHAKKLLSLLLSALAAVTLLASCGSRWDYSREGVKAANEAQGETLRVEFQVDQKFTHALHDAVEKNIQPADVEKAMLADASLKELLTSGYRLNVYALRADVGAEEVARTIAEEQILPRLSGCKDEGIISMVKADNNYFYEAVLTYKESSSGGGGGSEPGKPDDKPEEPVNQYTVTVVTLPEGEDLGTVTLSATEVEEGGEVTFTVEPNDDVTVVSIAAQVGETASFTYEYVEGTKYTISDIHGNVTITVEFKLEPPVFPVEWNAATGTLTFQVGSDGTTAATTMNSESLTEKAVRKGLEQQATWLTEHGFESFDASAFDLKGQVKHLIVKDGSGISGIGYCAFSYATDPQPTTPTKWNTTLESIDLSGVAKIFEGAFKGCTTLKELSLSGVQEIGYSAFYYDSGLAKIELSGIKTLRESAFGLCKNLTDVTLRGISIIEVGAFTGCEALTNVHLVGSEDDIRIQNATNDWGLGYMSGAFARCPKLAMVVIEGTLHEIAADTFSNINMETADKITNPNVTIRCTGGVDAFKAACPDQGDPTVVGLSSWEQVQAL